MAAIWNSKTHKKKCKKIDELFIRSRHDTVKSYTLLLKTNSSTQWREFVRFIFTKKKRMSICIGLDRLDSSIKKTNNIKKTNIQ